jgi:hypothetical protein
MAVWLILIYVKEITQKTREQRIRTLIASSKFLNNTKYFKTNKVSVAAYDSWAARGQVGGCSKCNSKSYIYTIHNKRLTKSSNVFGGSWSSRDIGGHLCEECYKEVEKQCNYKFLKW